jgi:hypothetical protein
VSENTNNAITAAPKDLFEFLMVYGPQLGPNGHQKALDAYRLAHREVTGQPSYAIAAFDVVRKGVYWGCFIYSLSMGAEILSGTVATQPYKNILGLVGAAAGVSTFAVTSGIIFAVGFYGNKDLGLDALEEMFERKNGFLDHRRLSKTTVDKVLNKRFNHKRKLVLKKATEIISMRHRIMIPRYSQATP